MLADAQFLKLLVLVNCAVPAAMLLYQSQIGLMGANPVNYAIRTTGVLALLSLVLSLVITPLIQLATWRSLAGTRRILGLSAFFYALAHFALFFWYDRAASLASTFSEMALRPYLTVGAAGLLMMLPLAITSTNGMIKRLGPTRWKLLHRLAYPAAIAGVVHYYLLVKADVRQPVAFGIALGLLLVYRLVRYDWPRLAESWRRGTPALAEQLVGNAQGTTPAVASVTRPWSGKLRVAEKIMETSDVMTFRLVNPAGGPLPFIYRPGQYLNVALPIDGQQVRRSYTISSNPRVPGFCDLTIKREPQGRASRYMHEQVQVGDELDIIAPAGRFVFTGEEAAGIVMIAGGVGITPLMSKIRYLTDSGWQGPIDLIYGARTQQDIIFHRELMDLAQRHSNLRLTLALSRETSPDWTGCRGRISQDLLAQIPDLHSRRVHFCGPTEMDATIRALLRELQVPEANVHSESFTSPATQQSSDAAPVGALLSTSNAPVDALVASMTTGADAATLAGAMEGGTIRFTRSGKSVVAAAQTTVLEAAQASGVSIEYDCCAGVCGTCIVKLVSGSVKMDSEAALSRSDREGGLILACQAHCLGDIEIEA